MMTDVMRLSLIVMKDKIEAQIRWGRPPHGMRATQPHLPTREEHDDRPAN